MYYFILFCLIGCAFSEQIINESNDNNWEQDSTAAQYLGLSSGASSVVPNIRATFSCLGRRYGYFADVDNNCQIFHVCHPSVGANGEPVIYHFSKFCPKSTRFDQRQLTCLSETDPKLLSCSDSIRYFPPTEGRFADVPVVQQFESIQQLPETEQRVEVLLEEPRRELVKGIQTDVRSQTVLNEGIPAKTVVRSEPIPEPQVLEPVVQQKAESLVQQVPEPVVQRAEPFPIQQSIPVQPLIAQPIEERNVEPIQQQVIPFSEPVVSVAQRSPVKQNVVTNTETLRAAPAVAPKGYVTPALALRNTQPVVGTPAQITRPVLIDSDINLRRTVPQNQYIGQNQPLVQPLYIPQQYIQQYQPLAQNPRVIRPSQYSEVVNRRPAVAQQQPIYYIPVQNYRSVPQYLRSAVQPNVVSNVVRPAQNPIFARVSNKQ